MPNARYDGNPMLRLLELYVLWAIDRLSRRNAEIMLELTPKLQKTFHCDGT